jgi:hypothetical protein
LTSLDLIDEAIESLRQQERTLRQRAAVSRLPAADGTPWPQRLWQLQTQYVRALDLRQRAQSICERLASSDDDAKQLAMAVITMRSEVQDLAHNTTRIG